MADERSPAELPAYAFLVESVDDAVWVTDLSGAIIAWNRPAELLTGRSAASVLGTDGTALVSELLRWGGNGVMARVLAGERIDRTMVEVLRRDGQLVPGLLTMSSLRDDGCVVGTCAVVRDLTEQVTTQETLSEVQTRLAEAQELANVGLWVWDEPNDAVQWSEQLHRITGVSPLDFEGTLDAHLAMVDPVDVDEVRVAMFDACATASKFSADFEISHPDGERHWVSVRGDPVVDSQGRCVGLRGICQDITPGQRAIEAFRVADAVKDEFLAVVSHELRTPLTSIVGFSALLESNASDEQARFIEVVQRNALEMRGMVERLLDFSRLESGRVYIDIQPVSVIEVLDEARDLAAGVLSGREVRVDIEDAPPMMADPNAMRQVLMNLLSNAAKFSEPDTPITVTAHLDDPDCVVSVTDEGMGIPADQTEQIFERFHQVPSNMVASKRGAGVGLSIVKRYIELQGGAVEVDSVEREGSTFRVILPAAHGR